MRAKGTELSRVAFFVVALPTVALAQPLGDEFQINTYTTGTQRNAAVARGPAGTFVVAWMGTEEGGPDAASGHYPGSYGIFARRFDRNGNPLGAEFQVNTFTTGYQAQPSLAVAANGSFVVVWMSYGDGGIGNYDVDGHPIGGYGIVGRRFAANGTALGGEFQVNSFTTFYQGLPRVTMTALGQFVVVWLSGFNYGSGSQYGQDGSYGGVFGQRFAANGTTLGAEFQVNAHTTGGQTTPSIAAQATGFVVAWNSAQAQDGNGSGVFARRFSAGGNPQGGEFQVNTFTTGHQSQPSIAATSDRGFVVTWTSTNAPDPLSQDGDFSGVFGQRFDRFGLVKGQEFQVNTHTTGNQGRPAVAGRPDGGFIVVWGSAPQPPAPNSSGQDGSNSGIFGQAFGSSGDPESGEFQVNVFTTGPQQVAAVAAQPNNGFVVVWRSLANQDGDDFGVFGRRFVTPR